MNQFDRTSQLFAATSAVAGFTSIAYPLNGLTSYSIQVDFSSASCTGVLSLQYSNTDVSYAADPDSQIPITAGGNQIYNVYNANYKYVKLVWTPTSGVGTITGTLEIKGIQG